MNNKYFVTAFTVLICIILMFIGTKLVFGIYTEKTIKVGFVYIGDEGTAYTNNFIRSQIELEEAFDGKVKTVAKYNIAENNCDDAIYDLVNQKCDLIFTTSYGYSESTKRIASEHPEVQFCQATGDNANTEPVLPNYHTFMGTIYEGRYVSGIVAGMKLLDLMRQGKLQTSKAKIGYVAAFPHPEVISGYTAFFLGVRSVVPEVTMSVRYTNTWSNYILEKHCAERLINEDGCILISQHSDTIGPATACEEASVKNWKTVFHVGYNQSMTDVAPTTSLVACRINWSPYILKASEAVLKNRPIESVVKSTIKGNDSGAGFKNEWVEMIGLNQLVAAPDTAEEIASVIRQFQNDEIQVFKGNYIGENPDIEDDIWDLRNPFPENKERSAPAFRYILRDVISVEEN